jgi:phage shock protein A
MWKRMKRVVSSRVDAILERNNDGITPDRLYRLKLEELEANLAKSRHAVMEAQSHVRSLEESLTKADKDIADTDARIREAVALENDSLAKERIYHLQNHQLRRSAIVVQLEESRQMLAKVQEVHEQAKMVTERRKVEAEIEFGVFRK